MPTRTNPKGGSARPRPAKVSAFRLSAATLALIDRLAESFRAAPEMTVTKTSVVELAVRELAERRLKGTSN